MTNGNFDGIQRTLGSVLLLLGNLPGFNQDYVEAQPPRRLQL